MGASLKHLVQITLYHNSLNSSSRTRTAYPNLSMAHSDLGCSVNDGINTYCMLQNCGSVFYCLSQCCIYRKLAIFTDPYYLECLYLSQMRKTQLSLLQMGQKGTTFYRMKAGHICLWKRLIDIVGLPIELSN